MDRGGHGVPNRRHKRLACRAFSRNARPLLSRYRLPLPMALGCLHVYSVDHDGTVWLVAPLDSQPVDEFT